MSTSSDRVAATEPELRGSQLNLCATVVERFAREMKWEAAYEVAAEMRRVAEGRLLREKFDV